MVTGCPEVRLTPYIGAVVLYVVLHSRDGARFSGLHCGLLLLLLMLSLLLLLVLLTASTSSATVAVGFVLFLISAGVVLAGLACASLTAGLCCCCCFLLLALTRCLLFELFLLFLFLPGFLFLLLLLSRTAAVVENHCNRSVHPLFLSYAKYSKLHLSILFSMFSILFNQWMGGMGK